MKLHSRRRRASQLAGVGLATTLILTACAGGSGDSQSEESDSTATGEDTAQTESDSPFGAPADEPLEVYLFDGGYGTEYADGFVEVYNRTLPNSAVEVKATQEISTQLQPRFVAGSPPDVIDNSGQPVDGKTLLEDGQLYDLQVLLDAPSLDDPSKTVAETLTDGVVEAGSFGGEFVQLPYVNTVMGMWYSASLFEERGWEVPTTWEDFIALGEEVKDEGISLFAYPGQAPSYAATFWMALAVKEGGEELMLNIDNLQPDAWRDPAVEGAFEAMVELSDKGLILEGSEALSHTEAQTEFVLGKALFYPCGSWLENEMENITPEGFEMSVAPIPLLSENAAMDASAIQVSPLENFIVPSKSNNPEGGVEFLRSMLTKEAAQNFSQLTGAPTVVKDALEGVEVTPGLASATAAIENASRTDINLMLRSWYSDLRKPWVAAIAETLAGRMSAADAVEEVQAAADAVAADDDVVKYTRD